MKSRLAVAMRVGLGVAYCRGSAFGGRLMTKTCHLQ
jgi:hypothetical protein